MFKKAKFLIVGLATLLMFPYNMMAQESDLGNWLIYIGSKKLNSKWPGKDTSRGNLVAFLFAIRLNINLLTHKNSSHTITASCLH